MNNSWFQDIKWKLTDHKTSWGNNVFHPWPLRASVPMQIAHTRLHTFNPPIPHFLPETKHFSFIIALILHQSVKKSFPSEVGFMQEPGESVLLFLPYLIISIRSGGREDAGRSFSAAPAFCAQRDQEPNERRVNESPVKNLSPTLMERLPADYWGHFQHTHDTSGHLSSAKCVWGVGGGD